MAAVAAALVAEEPVAPMPPRTVGAALKQGAGVAIAVARCIDCGLDLGQVALSGWERLHLPTNPWGQLLALAELHKARGCDPMAVVAAEATATERLRAIEAWSRRCSSDCGGLMALGAHVRQLLSAGGGR